MGFEEHSAKVWCANCRQFKPRATAKDIVSADGLRRKPVCLDCRTSAARRARESGSWVERIEENALHPSETQVK